MAASGATPDTKALGFKWAKLERVQGDIARLEEDKAQTTRRLSELELEKRQAESADREAYAAALMEGKDAPKTSKAEKVQAEREAMEDRKAALETALKNLSTERVRIIRENRTGWQKEIADKLPGVKQEVQETSIQMQEAVEELNSLVLLYNYLLSPERGYNARTAVGTVRIAGQQIGVDAFLKALNNQVSGIERREHREASEAPAAARDVEVRL